MGEFFWGLIIVGALLLWYSRRGRRAINQELSAKSQSNIRAILEDWGVAEGDAHYSVIADRVLCEPHIAGTVVGTATRNDKATGFAMNLDFDGRVVDAELIPNGIAMSYRTTTHMCKLQGVRLWDALIHLSEKRETESGRPPHQ